MKKKVLSLLLASSMTAVLLAGCGSTETAITASTSTDAAETSADNAEAEVIADGEEVAISFYTTETGKDDMFKAMIEDFESKNPGITVEYIAAGDDQLQAWMALYAGNEGPTVSLMDPINIYENQERMLAFDESNAPFLSNISEASLATMTFDGKVYAAPCTAAGIGLLYNKSVCDKAVGGDFDPSTIKTRSDLEELFEKIEATGVAATCLTGVNWSLGAHYLCQTYGAEIGTVEERTAYVASLKAGEVSLMDDATFNGYMDTFDLLAKYNYNKADPLVGDVNLDAMALATGECGTWFMGDWAWTYMSDLVTEDNEFGLMPVPVNDDPSDPVNSSIPTSYAKGYCVDASQNTEAQQAAGLKFINYLTTDDYAMDLMARTCGQAVPYKSYTGEIKSPLGKSTASYISAGQIYDFYGTPDMVPSDFWYENGAYMCEYLAGACDRATLAGNVEAYWKNQN